MFGPLSCTFQDDIPTFDCVPVLFGRVIEILLFFLGAVTLAFLLWGSLKFIHSSGDPKAVASAKNTMTYAMIGLVVVLLSFAILNFVGEFLGLPKGQLLQFSFGQ